MSGEKLRATLLPPAREKVDLIEQKQVRIELEGGNRLLPKVFLDDKLFHDLCLPWNDALIVKLVGKDLGFQVMKNSLQQMWKPNGAFDLIDVGNGFFIVKFDKEEDRMRVMNISWLLFDHHLCVRTWSPEFESSTARIDSTLVWIRFPNLNLVYYDESFLMAVGRAIGKPIRVDLNALKVSRGMIISSFPRVCVEIDIGKPVVRKVGIRNHWYTVEYEGLSVCSTCGCYGHLTRDCKPLPSTPAVNVAPETIDKVVISGKSWLKLLGEPY